MKNQFLTIIITSLGIVFSVQQARAADLWQVYQQALKSDPTFKAALEAKAAEDKVKEN